MIEIFLVKSKWIRKENLYNVGNNIYLKLVDGIANDPQQSKSQDHNPGEEEEDDMETGENSPDSKPRDSGRIQPIRQFAHKSNGYRVNLFSQ